MIPNKFKNDLILAARPVIDDVCQKRMGEMRHPPKSEVDFIASLIENGVERIEKAWRDILSPNGVDVRFAGLFCHQSPMVRIDPKRRCELADLLLIHSHVNKHGKEYWRAVLVQAKICAPGKTIKKPDEPQFYLYNQWPDFSICSPGFNPRPRDFRDDERSGCYALVSKAGWFIAPPAKPLNATAPNPDLGTYLVEMLYDIDPHQKGRLSTFGRQVYQNSKFDWSPTIWDLLRLTALKSLRHRGKAHGNYHKELSRLGGHFYQLLSELGDGDKPPGETAFFEDEGDTPSILIVRTKVQ